MNIDKSVYIADGAKVVGRNITIGMNSSIWYNCVVRCDRDETVTIGERTNLQDLSVIHVGPGSSVYIGDDVSIGHMCLIHGCTIGDNTLIGMGSIIMDGAKIGKNCIIGAGSLVTYGKEIPDGCMAFGRPAKVIRELTDEEMARNSSNVTFYMEEARELMEQAEL